MKAKKTTKTRVDALEEVCEGVCYHMLVVTSFALSGADSVDGHVQCTLNIKTEAIGNDSDGYDNVEVRTCFQRHLVHHYRFRTLFDALTLAHKLPRHHTPWANHPPQWCAHKQQTGTKWRAQREGAGNSWRAHDTSNARRYPKKTEMSLQTGRTLKLTVRIG